MNAAVSSARNASVFPELKGPLWLARRLGLHGVLVDTAVLSGVTDAAERRARLKDLLRDAIVKAGCEVVICGRGSDGKPNTYAEAFERMYGEAL